jgi:hypothetical protein
MTTAKWILCVIAASATSSYVTFLLNQPIQNELNAASNIENFNHRKSSNINSTEQPQELAKNTDNTRDNCTPTPNQTARHLADIGANNVDQAQSASIEDLQLSYEKKQNEMNYFHEFIQKNGDGVLSVISKNYNSEPIDPAWARSKEDELLALLETNETLQNTAPLELSCKSKNCRLVLSVQDGNQGESLYNAFRSDALKGSEENKKQVISYFSNPNNKEIHIYLSQSTISTLLDGKID